MDSIIVECFLPFAFRQALIQQRQTAAGLKQILAKGKQFVQLMNVRLPSALYLPPCVRRLFRRRYANIGFYGTRKLGKAKLIPALWFHPHILLLPRSVRGIVL